MSTLPWWVLLPAPIGAAIYYCYIEFWINRK